MFEVDILPHFGINPRVLEYDSANSVTRYFNCGKFFFSTLETQTGYRQNTKSRCRPWVNV